MPPPTLSTARWTVPLFCGAIFLVIALFNPTWPWSHPARIVVMLDLSASTRTAAYRDQDYLHNRLSQLLAGHPYTTINFGSEDNTTFTPPDADAILLFSDGQFQLPPVSPPTYPILDPNLNNTSDASITILEIRGPDVAVSVHNSGPPRILTVDGTTREVTANQTFLFKMNDFSPITATLSPGDPWPENDSLQITPAPPLHTQRWWVTSHGGPPPGVWLLLTPNDLANLAPSDFLSASTIVLNDISASDLPPIAQDKLETYVRDLGGTLLILGGPHAFAAGGYDGTTLALLSPLASSPPTPTLRWLLLADASGSMNDNNLFSQATSALVALLPHLPPSDPVWIGQFSDDLRWWSTGNSAAETSHLPLPPSDAFAHGPTNLEATLDKIAADTPGPMPTELLLITDADADFTQPAQLAAALQQKQIHLHLLAIGHGRGLQTLQKIAATTNGSTLEQLDPTQWPIAIHDLYQSALPNLWNNTPATVHFTGPAASLAARNIPSWNRTWLIPAATPLTQSSPLAALQQFGSGRVVVAAFSAPDLAPLFAQPPADPRFRIHWIDVPTPTLSIDALDTQKYLNDLPLKLTLLNGPEYSIPQIAPGHYQLTIPAPRDTTIASILLNGAILDQSPLASHYPAEFDAIGTNLTNLNSLAHQSAGQIIPPDQITPITFPPAAKFDLMPWFATAASLFVATGLILWHRT